VLLQLMMDNMMSRASDVYSFGIIMYELLTFRIPFDLLGKEQVGYCCQTRALRHIYSLEISILHVGC
jgi:serine/threonine protein kinase